MREKVRQRTPDSSISSEKLLHSLAIREQDVAALNELFRSYAAEKKTRLDDEYSVIRAIRHFLHEKKAEIRDQLSHSILGQSGCFAFSAKAFLLAANAGIQTNLARSTGKRALHVLLVSKEGEPYDIRELKKGRITSMTMEQVRAYGRYLQPFVGLGNDLRDIVRRPKEGAADFVACNEEVEA